MGAADPPDRPPLAYELVAGLDQRLRELGQRALTNPEPWLTRQLGPPPGPQASPALRDDYARRAGTAAAYREARGITDPQQAVSFDPHPEPELETMRQDTIRALESAMQLEDPRPRPEIPEPEPDGTDERAARLDELQTRAAAAAARVAADNAERNARVEYVARIERQAQAEAEAATQAETLPDAELEL